MFKSLFASNPPNYLINKKSTKTCFKGYNQMRAQGFKFGAFYLMKLGRNKTIFVKVNSRENSEFVEPPDQSVFDPEKKRNFRRILNTRLQVVLFDYCGYPFKRLIEIYKQMKSAKPNESCKSGSQPPKKAIEVPQTNDYQKNEIVESTKTSTSDQPPKNAIEVPQTNEKQPKQYDLDSNFHALTIDKETVKCELCNESFSGAAKLQTHKIDKHNECKICFRLFINKIYLAQHLKAHDPTVGKYCCSFCSMKFLNMPLLRYHLVKVHGEMCYLCCPKCPKAFDTADHFNQHEKTHKLENILCSLCNAMLKTAKHYKLHYRNVHRVAVPLRLD